MGRDANTRNHDINNINSWCRLICCIWIRLQAILIYVPESSRFWIHRFHLKWLQCQFCDLLWSHISSSGLAEWLWQRRTSHHGEFGPGNLESSEVWTTLPYIAIIFQLSSGNFIWHVFRVCRIVFRVCLFLSFCFLFLLLLGFQCVLKSSSTVGTLHFMLTIFAIVVIIINIINIILVMIVVIVPIPIPILIIKSQACLSAFVIVWSGTQITPQKCMYIH